MNGDPDETVDLDRLLAGPAAESAPDEITDCICGERRANLRYAALSPCHGRALAQLKAAHREEFDRLHAAEKEKALVRCEEQWRAHLAGDHGRWR